MNIDTSGWIDLQVNGFLGADFSAPDLTLQQIRDVTAALRERGTSAYCPTLVTSAPGVFERNLPIFAQAMREDGVREHLAGIHLEGPFLCPPSNGAHALRWLTPRTPRASTPGSASPKVPSASSRSLPRHRAPSS